MKKLIIPVFLFVFWEALSLLINRPILPQPWEVLWAIITKYPTKLLFNAGASLIRVLIACSISALFGLICAVFSAINPKIDQIIYKIVYLLHPIPKIALLPVVMVLFGLGEASKIALLVLICFFPCCISARDAISSLDQSFTNVFKSLGASKKQLIFKLYLPAAAPSLLEGIRLCVGTAFSVLFFSESFGKQLGLGSFILDAWIRVSYVEMFCGITTISLVCFLMYIIIDRLQKSFRH